MINENQDFGSKLVKRINLNIIKKIQKEKFNIKNPEILNEKDFSDLSDRLMKSILVKNESIRTIDKSLKYFELPIKKIQEIKTKPILEKTKDKIEKPLLKRPPVFMNKSMNFNKPKIPEHKLQQPVLKIKTYGKIDFLIKDNSISFIQCYGPDKQVSVIQSGQKNNTPIILTQEEISNLLDQFSEEAHIPLIEGPFQISVNNLNISGVYSSLIGSSFIIKKQ
ncbi:MAG: hypothetical protein PHX15_01915 [Candidatus Nanoarchaeia archaeon]|jgi:hypothetical protein|nr:hypothetical protein [Candidatus Nanoarchaeia archaeon]MDD3993931.1 hypothetical protein [Candidatus Nanoarchaeia archaeon]MDD4563394.1 hypothetical protein [Candidatus Nanoarchaeia archaeon]